MNTTHLIQFAGVTHLGLLAAGALMPGVVQLRQYVATLPPFIRRLFWTYYAFLGLCLVSFGTISFFAASELASGTPLARAVCLFLAVFWTLRLLVAAFVFDLKPYLTNGWRKLGYHLTNIVFAALPLIYAWAALGSEGNG
ncbi:MAG: hypothetical protein AB7O52_14865 [Planctomycetota bacterium]